MFQLSFSPMRRDDVLTVSAASDVLILNGATLDLSGLPEGATLPRGAVACDWLADDITRAGGRLHLTLILPIGPDAPDHHRFPQPVMVTMAGPVTLPTDPAKREPEPEEAAE